jgi:hypothetical protein
VRNYNIKVRADQTLLFEVEAEDEEQARGVVERWGTSLPHSVLDQDMEVEEVREVEDA